MSWGKLLRFAVWGAAAAIIAAPIAYQQLFPVPTRYSEDVDHFKYASVGVEAASGVPYEIWRTLPGICMSPDDAKAGYRRFGFLFEPNRATPIGMPVETAIVPRVGINCALCHVGRVETAAGQSKLLIGAPNTSLDLQSYLQFMFGCVSDKRFTADAVLAENDRLGGYLSAVQRLMYRYLIIPQVEGVVAEQQRQLSFMTDQTKWGPGRAAGFQPAKVQVLGIPFDGTLDVVDTPPLWAMARRDGGGLHWDGVNTSLHEVVLSSGIGNGASAHSINLPNLNRIETWVRTLPPAPYPFAINPALATSGKAIFTANCAECHAVDGAKAGQVIPLRMIGTDRNRADAFTPETAIGFKAMTLYPWRYTMFRETNGYVAASLDGLWARAPYLHNGSVPTLAALLSPPAERPTRFARGSPRYDPLQVGFASDQGAVFDTSLPGNSSAGHVWGTALSPADRSALIEYLKTL